jgi:hypothetical protein
VTGAAAAAASSSAARQALGLYELISAILTHVQPADCCAYTEANDNGDTAGRYSSAPFSAAAIETAAARATLRAAILVNRMWFMAGVPILWCCLPDDAALDCVSVPEPARRAFYASQIRHVSVAKRGALWQSLSSGTSSVADAAGRVRREHVSGTGHGATDVALPRLTSLRAAMFWTDVHARSPSISPTEAMRHNLAVLMAYIHPELEELSCHITADLLDRLSTLQGRSEANDDDETPRLPAVIDQAWRHEDERTKLGSTRLRKLNLYQSMSEPWTASTGTRLLALLAKPGLAPMLSSVKLCELFNGSMASLADDAFRHFALRDDLEQLWLGKYPCYMDMVVSEAAINNIATCGSRGVCDAEYLYRHGRFQLVPRIRSNGRRPFEQLRDLLVAVACERSVTLLAPFLVSLTHLSLSVGRAEAWNISDEEILQSLSTLENLQHLKLKLGGLSAFTGAGLVHLRSLTQLQVLQLDAAQPSRFNNSHLATLLTSLPCLRSLGLHINLKSPWYQAVKVIGENCPRLRCLFLRSPYPADLATIFDSHCHAPLFPYLEILGLPGAGRTTDNLRCVGLLY